MLDQGWLSTFAPVGRIPAPQQWQACGAGVFIAHRGIVWQDNPLLSQCMVDDFLETLYDAGWTGTAQVDGNLPCEG